MSDRSYLAIGEVLALLQEEFPDVTISKIRFLESQGLIDPERTASGYRKFYSEDIERLRFILREQKEHFLPLKVIKDRLASGEVPATSGAPAAVTVPAVEAVPPLAVAVADGAPERLPIWMTRNHPAAQVPLVAAPPPPDEPPLSLTFDELASAAGLSVEQLREVEKYQLLAGKQVGRVTYYDADALAVARAAAGFIRNGLEPRHLRLYRTLADREASLFEGLLLPLMKQRNPQARADALARLQELQRLGQQLRETLLHQALRSYTEG